MARAVALRRCISYTKHGGIKQNLVEFWTESCRFSSYMFISLPIILALLMRHIQFPKQENVANMLSLENLTDDDKFHIEALICLAILLALVFLSKKNEDHDKYESKNMRTEKDRSIWLENCIEVIHLPRGSNKKQKDEKIKPLGVQLTTVRITLHRHRTVTITTRSVDSGDILIPDMTRECEKTNQTVCDDHNLPYPKVSHYSSMVGIGSARVNKSISYQKCTDFSTKKLRFKAIGNQIEETVTSVETRTKTVRRATHVKFIPVECIQDILVVEHVGAFSVSQYLALHCNELDRNETLFSLDSNGTHQKERLIGVFPSFDLTYAKCIDLWGLVQEALGWN
uniref:Phosphatidylinositol N-acetylglucosaminyltransferase subunit H conserved domain-containing protein n=1 Tax=Corethron hystrix TaxID=216773 RepID=A0A7S1BN37_9STRA|mmetsp:Transcript_33467/g.77186  ORF Transcript_33467/g.77186 Transcript_33467/m.77186 type:complete len:340 (+) Transcript_33467:118-1137(+)